MKLGCRTLFALIFLTACSDGMELVLKERTVTPLGPSGGRAMSAEGKLALDFVPGALSERVEITIDTRRDRTVPRGRSLVYELSPHGLTFAVPVTLTISAAPEDEVEELAIANVDGAFPEVLVSSSWDRARGVLSAHLEHFSSYAVVAVYNPCARKTCGETCVVCDPLNAACLEPETLARS